MKRVLITISAVVFLGLTGLTAMALSTTTRADSPEVSVQANEQTRSFAIENMTCAMCSITVKMAMTRVEGVKSVSVDSDAKTATAVFDPTVTTAQEIAAATTNVGYPTTPIEE